MPPAKGRTPMSKASRVSTASRASKAHMRVGRVKKSIHEVRQTPSMKKASKKARVKPSVKASKKSRVPFKKRKDFPDLSEVIKMVRTAPDIRNKFEKIEDKDINILCLFKFPELIITEFRNFIHSSRDCVVSVMQLIGIIDTYTANILRILFTGITQDQIIGIITLYAGYKLHPTKYPFKYKFQNLTTYILGVMESSDPISEWIEFSKIKPNQGVFTWMEFVDRVTGAFYRHCVYIVRNTEGVLQVIDPQKEPSNRILPLDRYFSTYVTRLSVLEMLYRSKERLTIDDLVAMGFTGLDGSADLDCSDCIDLETEQTDMEF